MIAASLLAAKRFKDVEYPALRDWDDKKKRIYARIIGLMIAAFGILFFAFGVMNIIPL
jgi:hypothetical protein